MTIRILTGQEIPESLALAWTVFQQYEAPDYSEAGIEAFRRSLQDPGYTGQLTLYGAFENGILIGMLATRDEGRHIALFFVDGRFQRRGIGRALFAEAHAACLHGPITVNAAPYAVEIYRRLGFVQADAEQLTDGLRYIPMRHPGPAAPHDNQNRGVSMKPIVIRENIPTYMAELKAWLEETAEQPLESMTDFFAARIGEYEEHMAVWRDAYAALPSFLPEDMRSLLDLGCGTGLELDVLLAARPGLSVTGIDLSASMLANLRRKHPAVRTICADYFSHPFEQESFDAVMSFETLHHFKPEKKRDLFQKIRRALPAGGLYLEVDYLACCDEEETLLMAAADARRQRDRIPAGTYVHFDTPLTPDHEMQLLTEAGFRSVAFAACINGAAVLTATA